ncbi:ribulose-phosphate 3-epimerase [Erysipelothrix sp. HDW6A]|uniref:ribulose-phosphate 3-epimerase n=1 Tax=Erysipelothrix sp. HDW6A TaxID=2714928 RepID=UPI00140BD2B1|nr:ribulose-phosphate 3-epimerase [Erysipelothrix sp. HDW6A]QIK58199.1 ribulose-phosphate 3-epimerase [Erysipelothrix sp. HDW6A]
MKISPSIASSNLLKIGEEIERIGNSYDTLHVDIEDGNFVPNITFGFDMLDHLNEYSPKPFSIHLMVCRPEDYILKLSQYNCEYIFIHTGSTKYIRKVLQMIKKNGIKAGIALNPADTIDHLLYLVEDVDAILVMTSEPDMRNNAFEMKLLSKIESIVKKTNVEVWCDGGIGQQEMIKLEKLGVYCCVVGRSLFKQEDPTIFIEKMNIL